MLTLKVISTNIDGEVQTSLFYGESICHFERLEKASGLKDYSSDKVRIGSLINEASEQEFYLSEVFLNDAEGCLKTQLLILPKSDCFIMENGKTVDSFYSQFKN